MFLTRLTIAPTVLVLIFLIKTVNGQFDDPDFYWHVRTGEYIVTHGALPQTDVFSYTNFGRPWVLHEWLFQVLIYLVHEFGGELGVKICSAIGLTAIYAVNYATCKRLLGGDEGKALIVTLLFCSIITSVAPRPHLATFLFFSVFVYILAGFKYFGEVTRLWVVPLIMALWANLHGGYFVGLVLLWLFIATEWVVYRTAKDRDPIAHQRLVKLSVTGIAALLATLLNPEFVGYWLYPFQVIGMDASKGIIEEWRSPDFHEPIFIYWLIVVVVFIAALVHAPRRPDVTEFTIPLLFVAGSFVSRRNIPLAALAMAPFVAAFLSAGLLDRLLNLAPSYRTAATGSALTAITRKNLSRGSAAVANWLLIVVSAAALAAAYPVREKTIAQSLNTVIPTKATDFVVRENIGGNMYNAYHYGGYLIYRLYPAQRVFIDGRADMYGDQFIQESLAIYQGDPQWKARFEKYGIDYVLCESAAPLRQLLLEGSNYRLVFDDGMHSVLVKNADKYRTIIEKYGTKPAHD